jgi:uncharacterized protein YndB with AHSA1/START domain
MAEQETSERSVEREIHVPATREETWQALTDPERLRDWLAEEAELDLRPGGDLVVRTDGETREGFFEEVSEPERLVFWWAERDAELSRVEVELEEIDEGTRVRVVEARPLVSLEAVGAGIEFESGGASPQMSAVLQAVA